jgi:hypothetical protein
VSAVSPLNDRERAGGEHYDATAFAGELIRLEEHQLAERVAAEHCLERFLCVGRRST